ncbi:MAG: hypothetical protein EOP47_22325 [Sphingobacteriaceae bacterium]|nr:MAG: hypothetical protein EOP47_22325 [Sphingobacteriaceae bacterium]
MPVIDKNTVIFNTGKPVDFEYPIAKIIEIENVIVVILHIPPKREYNLNVFAFSLSGDFLWRIANTDLYYKNSDCPYVGYTLNENDQLVLFNWCDTAVVVDHNNGDILDKYVTK